MPHSPEEKKRAITRLRRIRGQAEALETAIDTGASCSQVLQQLAAVRGAVNGLMAEVLEGHLRESFGPTAPPGDADEAIDEVAALVRSYLR
ncbi:metal/formaldehyde-sensitive transcriptional repressor [Ottowia oryzae]|jgi:DNA-binding FrmR family transcriptional regulator|uniref:Regulator n=1 Tax=Ottowia oryzae TaxID=2109914 RepID=A0A2S0MBX7_9BURK|nr:metal/formaldehyde-sensitive transcriptional repressor [Ottowia oryzae]AVO33358.1 regulator [Ottowia oryzae]